MASIVIIAPFTYFIFFVYSFSIFFSFIFGLLKGLDYVHLTRIRDRHILTAVTIFITTIILPYYLVNTLLARSIYLLVIICYKLK